MARKRKVLLIATVLIAIFAGAIAWLASPLWWGSPGPRLVPESEATSRSATDTLPVLVLLSPGTVVGGKPPPGWSNSVIKSVLHLASGDLDTLPAFARATATRFRTVVLADVRSDPDDNGFRLRRVGAGISQTLDGRDMVINAASLKARGVSLGLLDSMVLGRAEAALGRSRLAASTPTFALYDSQVEHADASGKHHSIYVRYALVVDPSTGGLRTACWPMAVRPEDRRNPKSLTLLPADLTFRCGLHVEAKRIILGKATSWGIAMIDLPPGLTIPMPPALGELATRDPEGTESATVERAVRDALGDRPTSTMTQR